MRLNTAGIALVLVVLLLMCSGCTREVKPTTCTNDSDCVPAECCHPNGCINQAYKQPCTVLCTNVCEGPIDCGAGRCGCVEGRCDVISAEPITG